MLTADFLNGASIPFVLTSDAVLGRGATAEVHSVIVGDRRFAIKLYKVAQELNEAKILSMCAFGDLSKSDDYECAWPVAVVKSDNAMSGYLMETFDKLKHHPLNYLFDPTFFNRLNSIDVMSLSNRVEVALSLCSAIAALHSRKIYCIDLKPQNILVNWAKNTCVLLDCDGFSFRGSDGIRFPAGHISTDYIAPEATREKLTAVELGASQDKYALAVILFQLFNYAQHPFQGISSGVGMQSATNDEYAAAGLYPYGVTPNRLIAPRRGSTHECMPHELRTLFDRAFIGHPDQRVSAREWAKFFENIIEKKLLKRCYKHSNAPSHVSFQGGQCAECARLAFVDGLPKPKTIVPLQPSLASVPQQPSLASPLPPQPAPKDNTIRNVLLFGMLAVVAGYLFAGDDERKTTSAVRETTATPSNSSQKPTTKTKWKYESETVWLTVISSEWVNDSSGYKNTLRVLVRNESTAELRNPKFIYKLRDCNVYSKEVILEVQKKLVALGIPVGTLDGIFGNRTKDGVKSYQKKRGIKVTGQIDELLLLSLNVDESLELNQVITALPQASPIAAKKDSFIYVPNFRKYYTSGRRFCYRISAQYEKKVPQN
ncbi:MAG: peptidoglycan-binding protein [Porticoccaceae bacterium]|nr:peptidoglycan-binding protein [Porticoccaceae bacterium]